MSAASHRKSGAATRPSPNEEALRMPLGKRGKEGPPAGKGRKKDAARSKPGTASAPPSRALPPSPAAEARKGGGEPLPHPPELSKQIAEIAGKSHQLVAAFLTEQVRRRG